MTESAAESQLDTPSGGRLVIRVKLIPPEPQPKATPQRWNRSSLVIVGAVLVLLSWLGLSIFRSHSDPAPVDAESASNAGSESMASAAVDSVDSSVRTKEPRPTRAVESAVTGSAEPRPVESTARQSSSAPPTSLATINEVIPDVPRSALATIRGTVRVSIRVIVDEHGTVTAANVDDRGPSRYFAQLANDAAKKWTFPPAQSEQREFLLRFNFTRWSVTADSNSLPSKS